jgi:hypothetical protein
MIVMVRRKTRKKTSKTIRLFFRSFPLLLVLLFFFMHLQVHVLGSLSVLSVVDKQGILLQPAPVPQQVIFFQDEATEAPTEGQGVDRVVVELLPVSTGSPLRRAKCDAYPSLILSFLRQRHPVRALVVDAVHEHAETHRPRRAAEQCMPLPEERHVGHPQRGGQCPRADAQVRQTSKKRRKKKMEMEERERMKKNFTPMKKRFSGLIAMCFEKLTCEISFCFPFFLFFFFFQLRYKANELSSCLWRDGMQLQPCFCRLGCEIGFHPLAVHKFHFYKTMMVTAPHHLDNLLAMDTSSVAQTRQSSSQARSSVIHRQTSLLYVFSSFFPPTERANEEKKARWKTREKKARG